MPTIALAPVLDLASASNLKQDLLEAFAGGDAVAIEAGEVQRVSSPCLQILAAAVVRGASVSNPSAAFRDTAGALDLLTVLKLEEPDV